MKAKITFYAKKINVNTPLNPHSYFRFIADFQNERSIHLTENDKQILIEKYIFDFLNLKYITIENSPKKKKSTRTIEIIDSVLRDLEKDKKISNSRKDLIILLDSLSSKKRFLGRPIVIEDSQINLFKENQLGLIADLNFANQAILYGHLDSWSCNMSVETTEIYTSMDTLYLPNNRDYTLPIRIEYEGSNYAYSILSNSLQDNAPSSISLSLGEGQTEPRTFTYEVEAINNITGSLFNFKDSLFVYPIDLDQNRLY